MRSCSCRWSLQCTITCFPRLKTQPRPPALARCIASLSNLLLRDIRHTPRLPLKAFCFSLLLLFAFSCQRTADSPDLNVEFTVAPERPRVGSVTVDVRLSHKNGQPVSGARVELEGNMTHPGMSPVSVTTKEMASGSYRGTLELTMAGDWIILVNITLADGQRLQRQLELKGVQS